MKERIRAIPQAAQNGCSAFPLLRYLSFQCTSVRAGPPSSAPEQFSWTVNRNRVTGCGHMAPLDEALPGTPLLLPQPALSHGDHTPFSYHSQPSAMVATLSICVECGFPLRLLWVLCGVSVQFSRSVVSNSLRSHESQYTRPPCPSPTPRVHSNSCPSSR